MPPPVRTPRQAWIDAALAMLAESGPDAIRVETLATALGVTRGGFYRQFAGRQELLDAVLDTWEHRSTDEVRARIEHEGGDAGSKVRRAGLLTFSKELLPVDIAVREWSRRDPAVAARLARVDNNRMDLLRELLGAIVSDPEEVEARSLLAFSLLIGNHLIAAEHPGGTRDQVLTAAGRLLITP
ncbi:TetR/AcrR family transcriptional regulator [Nocardia sp. NBC_00511]|uniref:TetR/AcrR family transcriptional regulator n=1 Tax=Nocardia sp. NBC_00511 TaxID=2903591 RepID=UPI0030E0C49C